MGGFREDQEEGPANTSRNQAERVLKEARMIVKETQLRERGMWVCWAIASP